MPSEYDALLVAEQPETSEYDALLASPPSQPTSEYDALIPAASPTSDLGHPTSSAPKPTLTERLFGAQEQAGFSMEMGDAGPVLLRTSPETQAAAKVPAFTLAKTELRQEDSALRKAGGAAWNTVAGFVEGVTSPEGLEGLVNPFVGGAQFAGMVPHLVSEIKEAAKTPANSPERWQAAANLIGATALPLAVHGAVKLAGPKARPTLTERLFPSERPAGAPPSLTERLFPEAKDPVAEAAAPPTTPEIAAQAADVTRAVETIEPPAAEAIEPAPTAEVIAPEPIPPVPAEPIIADATGAEAAQVSLPAVAEVPKEVAAPDQSSVLPIPTESKAGGWLTKNVQKLFTAEGNIPKETFQRWNERHGEVKEQSRQTAYATRDLQSALRDEFGIGKGEELTKGFSKVPPEFVNQMNDALLGKADINALPERVRETLHRMREHVDDLSKSLVREGVVPEELVAKVEGNLGTYMTRSYRVFDDVKWPEKIAPEVRNKAADFVLKDLQRSNPAATPQTARAVLESMLSDWQQQGTGALLKSGGKLGSKDLTSLIARKDIPEVIRQFMGEYKDPVINYTRSVAKMSNLLGNARFLNDVRTQGKGKWLFEDGAQPETHSALIAAEGSDVMAPLNGLRTTPEIAEAFATFGKNEQVTNAWAKAYFRLNGIAKAGKTIGSVMTQVRNTVGQGYFWLMNGHFDVRPAGGAMKSIAADIGITDNVKWRESYKRYLKLNVVDQSAKAGELRDVIRDAALNDVNVPGLDAHRTLESVKKIAIDAPIRAYQISDDFGKIVGFENELARQKAINPEMPIAELEKIAAERIQNTYPTYTRVPEWVKQFRRQPVVGPFMTFAYESFRTAFHNLRYTAQDLASANPAQRKAGVQRLAGQMAVLGGGYAMGALSRSLLGLSVEDEDDVRRFLPRWDKNAQLAFTGVEKGKLNYINLSFANPYSYLTDPVMAVATGLRGDDEITTLMARSFGELMRPFASEDILANSMIDISRNTTETGGRVYNPQDTPENILAAKLKHVAEALEPGTSTRLRKKIVPALQGKTTPYGADLNPAREIASEVTGFKSQSLDYEQALAFKARGFRRNDTESEGLFRETALRRGEVSTTELNEAYLNSNKQRFGLWKDLYGDARAARRRGVSESAIRESLTGNGITKEDARAIMAGKYRPYQPGDDMADKLKRLGRKVTPEIKADISKSRKLLLSGEYQ